MDGTRKTTLPSTPAAKRRGATAATLTDWRVHPAGRTCEPRPQDTQTERAPVPGPTDQIDAQRVAALAMPRAPPPAKGAIPHAPTPAKGAMPRAPTPATGTRKAAPAS